MAIDSKFIVIMWNNIKNCTKLKNLFIDSCTLIGEIVIKFYNEELQDKYFEEAFDTFKLNVNSSEDPLFYKKFELFLLHIVKKMSNTSNILNVDNFLILLENFNSDIKLNLCNTIMQQLIYKENKSINDPYLAFSLLKIGKYIHDSIDIFSNDNNKRK